MYYVFCDDDCRHEGMTKEQIITAIEEAIEQGHVTDPSGAVISKIKEIRANNAAQIWIGTEAQFNALSPAPTMHKGVIRLGTNGVLYLCSDDTSLDGFAAANHTHIDYALVDHTHSGYAAVDHTHSGYSPTNHNHSGVYAPASHSHSEYAAASHNHSGTDITSGTVDIARLPIIVSSSTPAVQNGYLWLKPI